MARNRLYRNGVLELEDFPLADVSEHLREPGAVVWLDLTSPTPADLAIVADEFDLHALALEQVAEASQRPRLARLDGHLFLTAFRARVPRVRNADIDLIGINAFVTDQALITVHGADFDPGELVSRWDASPDLAHCGIGSLIYGLLDLVVDSHLDALQAMDERAEGLEDLLFTDRPRQAEVQRESFRIRKQLVDLRRAIVPMREVVNPLLRRDLRVLDDAIMPYLQDVYDHVMRATEWSDSLRELMASILETNLAIQGNRLNDIMKKVTSWAAIIAVPTAITGFYGQNVPYPGFAEPVGFIVSSSLIVLMSVGLFFFFRRKDWI